MHRDKHSSTLFLLAVARFVPAFKPLYARIVVLANSLGPVSFRTGESSSAVAVGNRVDLCVSFVRQIDGFDVKRPSPSPKASLATFSCLNWWRAKDSPKGPKGTKRLVLGAMKYEKK